LHYQTGRGAGHRDEHLYVKAESNDNEQQCNLCDSTYCVCNLNISQDNDDSNCGINSGARIAGSRRAIKLQAKFNARLAKAAERAAKRARKYVTSSL
jgi:hypothetical protein